MGRQKHPPQVLRGKKPWSGYATLPLPRIHTHLTFSPILPLLLGLSPSVSVCLPKLSSSSLPLLALPLTPLTSPPSSPSVQHKEMKHHAENPQLIFPRVTSLSIQRRGLGGGGGEAGRGRRATTETRGEEERRKREKRKEKRMAMGSGEERQGGKLGNDGVEGVQEGRGVVGGVTSHGVGSI